MQPAVAPGPESVGSKPVHAEVVTDAVVGGERAIELGCDVIMATLNLDEQAEAELIDRAGREGVGVLVKKALASGHSGTESLRFAATASGVSSVIVGTINPDHLRDNARIVSEAAASAG